MLDTLSRSDFLWLGKGDAQCVFLVAWVFVVFSNASSLIVSRFRGWDTESYSKKNEQQGKAIITNITDGESYKRLCEAGQFLNNPANISFIFNSDSAPLYSSSSLPLLPVILTLNDFHLYTCTLLFSKT